MRITSLLTNISRNTNEQPHWYRHLRRTTEIASDLPLLWRHRHLAREACGKTLNRHNERIARNSRRLIRNAIKDLRALLMRLLYIINTRRAATIRSIVPHYGRIVRRALNGDLHHNGNRTTALLNSVLHCHLSVNVKAVIMTRNM